MMWIVRQAPVPMVCLPQCQVLHKHLQLEKGKEMRSCPNLERLCTAPRPVEASHLTWLGEWRREVPDLHSCAAHTKPRAQRATPDARGPQQRRCSALQRPHRLARQVKSCRRVPQLWPAANAHAAAQEPGECTKAACAAKLCKHMALGRTLAAARPARRQAAGAQAHAAQAALRQAPRRGRPSGEHWWEMQRIGARQAALQQPALCQHRFAPVLAVSLLCLATGAPGAGLSDVSRSDRACYPHVQVCEDQPSAGLPLQRAAAGAAWVGAPLGACSRCQAACLSGRWGPPLRSDQCVPVHFALCATATCRRACSSSPRACADVPPPALVCAGCSATPRSWRSCRSWACCSCSSRWGWSCPLTA